LSKSKNCRKEQENQGNKYVFFHDFFVCDTNIGNKSGITTIPESAFNFFMSKKRINTMS